MRRIPFIALLFAGIIALFPHYAQANGDALAFYQIPSAAPSPKAIGRKSGGYGAEASRGAVRGGAASAAVASAARQHGIPVSLALAVCHVESRCRFGLVGRAGERGPMQIKLATARGLGYSGSASGLNGYAGAYWGVKHLSIGYRKCGTARGAAKLHNAGLAASCSGSRYTSRVMAAM
jgi:soluble lytic murein transglycosylase-like protein